MAGNTAGVRQRSSASRREGHSSTATARGSSAKVKASLPSGRKARTEGAKLSQIAAPSGEAKKLISASGAVVHGVIDGLAPKSRGSLQHPKVNHPGISADALAAISQFTKGHARAVTVYETTGSGPADAVYVLEFDRKKLGIPFFAAVYMTKSGKFVDAFGGEIAEPQEFLGGNGPPPEAP